MRTKTRAFGYLHLDHRNSPGLPDALALQVGYDPLLCREGQVYESYTLGCAHCGAHVVINPWRRRDRGWCAKCDAYICDACTAALKAGCVHRTIQELADLVNSGRWSLSGNMSRPMLVPTARS